MPAKAGSRKKSGMKSKPVTQSSRADTLFPVGRLNRLLKHGRYSERVSNSAGVFLAGMLEYLTAEIIELAGAMCHGQKKKTINPKHLNLGIRNDQELSQLMCEVTIAAGGKLVHVEDFFKKAKKGEKAAAMGSQPV